MSTLGWFHITFAILAMASGAYVILATKKGTRLHRQIGWVYVATMVLANVTALMIYRLFGGFGPFHAFAIISLMSMTSATLAGMRARTARVARDAARREKAIGQHYMSMGYSYVGLMAAFASEVVTRVPGARPGNWMMFTLAVSAATGGVFVVGAWLVHGRKGLALLPFKSARVGE